MGEYNTPEIITAAKNGDVEKLKRLLDVKKLKCLINSGSYVDSIDLLGATALCWAADMGHSECVDLLLAAGANVNEAKC